MRLIGKCSVCGAMSWPRGEVEHRLDRDRRAGRGTGDGALLQNERERGDRDRLQHGAQRRGAGRWGARLPIIASQSSFTFTVLIKRSKLPASFLIEAESLLDTTWVAPKPLGFVELALAARERGDLAAVGGGELDGHVTESRQCR